MIAILGGGISGISAGYHLSLKCIENTVFEKKLSWGGLCDNFTIGNGFRFDYFIHLSFTDSEYVKDLFKQSSEYISHHPASNNYYRGHWLKHPAQNNLAPLSAEEKTKIILDFINKPEQLNPLNYRDWLLFQFGENFTANFPGKYTNKYWTVPAEELTTDWLGNRFSLPSLKALLKGAFEEQQENFYYAKEMRYPTKGGYKSFLTKMASQTNIKTNKEAVQIDLKAKRIDFADNTFIHYDQLISSLPLPELIKLIKNVPNSILEASDKLLCTSGQLVSLGFNRPDIPKNIWFYIYDEDILPARAYSPSLKSRNNAPEGKSSLQFETYFSKRKEAKLKGGALIEHVVEKGAKMGLFTSNDIEVSDYREVKYANVVFDFNRKENVGLIHNYLDKMGIKYIGRFGEWDYLWSDQSLLSGKKISGYV
ncbi:MAG: FAD-dependent oxidoreductase [Candidatus Atribacteria bacterium]|nr:FAD-dependent oxidoreductase [Candidatus Atribacteria bacterium]